jgi:hypothetical protein
MWGNSLPHENRLDSQEGLCPTELIIITTIFNGGTTVNSAFLVILLVIWNIREGERGEGGRGMETTGKISQFEITGTSLFY